MFVPTIEKQGTAAQRDKWIPLSKNLEVIGTYAQTELGHGIGYNIDIARNNIWYFISNNRCTYASSNPPKSQTFLHAL